MEAIGTTSSCDCSVFASPTQKYWIGERERLRTQRFDLNIIQRSLIILGFIINKNEKLGFI